MLKDRIKGKIYKDMIPTVIIRKSRGRLDINKIIKARLTKIWTRRLDQPSVKSMYALFPTLNKNNKYTKGGYSLSKNGVPLNNKRINPLKNT